MLDRTGLLDVFLNSGEQTEPMNLSKSNTSCGSPILKLTRLRQRGKIMDSTMILNSTDQQISTKNESMLA